MKLYLTFICRDNEDVIGEMIESCLPIIDGIIAVDTGSVDGTITKIESTVAAYRSKLRPPNAPLSYKLKTEVDLPLVIYRDKWVNFGHNRSLMMEHCKKHKADYLLVMDSDEILVIKPDFNKEEIVEDCIMINTPGDAYTYPRDRIFKNDLTWVWKGAAHEYPHSDQMQSKKIEKNLELKLRPKPAGYTKHIERNRDLLLQDYEKNPDDPRTNYYLGLTYRDLGKYITAAEFLSKRASMENTWEEERWHAMYALGKLYDESGEVNKAEEKYLAAFEFRPTRAEPLLRLGIMLNKHGQRNKALMYIRMAKNIEKPKGDTVFVEHIVYDWECDFELSHMLYYDTSTIEEGYQLCLDLVSDKYKLPKHILDKVYENIRHYDNYFINQGKPKRFIIELPEGYDGLGDHLLYSHLPELVSKIFPEVDIYVSEFNTYKTPGTKEIVWERNPYIKGFIKAKGTYRDMNSLNQVMRQLNGIAGMTMMDQIAVFYGLNPFYLHKDGETIPYIHESLRFKYHKKLKKLRFFDGNYKHFAGVTKKQILDFIKEHDIKFDYQVRQMPGTNYIELPDVPGYRVVGIEQYITLLNSVREFYCLMTGTTILNAGLYNKNMNVFVGKNNLSNYMLRSVNNYIEL